MQETTNWQDNAALERYQMISPLLDPGLDNARRIQQRCQIAENNQLSVRTIYRYEKSFRENQFTGLRPMNRTKRRSQRLPDNWDEIVGEAILLKREVPKRSARQIIKILEIENWAPPGVIKESTLRRYLFKAGLGVKQMRRYAEARATSSRRFCREHRMELIQADIKYGPDIRTKEGKLIKTYLSSLIDEFIIRQGLHLAWFGDGVVFHAELVLSEITSNLYVAVVFSCQGCAVVFLVCNFANSNGK